MKQPRTLLLILFLLGCIAVDANVLRRAWPAVNAEEQGISVALHYQRGYSTWGPTNVYGTAVLWPQEQVATLTVHLLPHLEGGDRYVWWVINTGSGAAVRLGTFNTTNAGDQHIATYLNHGLPAGANAVLVTIAVPTDPLRAPAASRSLYGAMVPLPLSVQRTRPVPVPGGTGTGPGKPQPGRTGSHTGVAQGTPMVVPARLPMTGGAATATGRTTGRHDPPGLEHRGVPAWAGTHSRRIPATGDGGDPTPRSSRATRLGAPSSP